MFKLTIGEINKTELAQALQELGALSLPVKASWNITRMCKQINKAIMDNRDMYFKIMKEHSVLDENGEMVCQTRTVKGEDGEDVEIDIPQTSVVKEGEQEILDKKMNEFMAIEVEIKSFKIKIAELQGVTLSPRTLTFLEALIDDEPDESDCDDNVLPLKGREDTNTPLPPQ